MDVSSELSLCLVEMVVEDKSIRSMGYRTDGKGYRKTSNRVLIAKIFLQLWERTGSNMGCIAFLYSLRLGCVITVFIAARCVCIASFNIYSLGVCVNYLRQLPSKRLINILSPQMSSAGLTGQCSG